MFGSQAFFVMAEGQLRHDEGYSISNVIFRIAFGNDKKAKQSA